MNMWLEIIFFTFISHELYLSSALMRDSSRQNPHISQGRKIDLREKSAEYWYDIAQKFLKRAKSKKPNTNIAKNAILFLGDGMSVPTITAARIYAGGESHELSFEKFPYTAVSKTYNLDRLVSESTSTATAYLCGVKANWYTSGLTGAVKTGDCEGSLLPENQIPSIAEWSQKEDKWTGFVTTARITHATPAGLYSHTANRLWESDFDVMNSFKDPGYCPDIAKQLIHSEIGQNFHVILGCGRNKFMPKQMTDEEGKPGHRLDKKNLIEEWKTIKAIDKKNFEYVWNRKQLLEFDNETDYLLGMFEDGMCKFNVDRDPEMDPSLEEMTEAAITKLRKSPKGYFLFVEGALIDYAHHRNLAGKALDETVEFSKAVHRAVEMTNEDDTLIVVTADHAHTMSIGGYPKRGSNILGLADFTDLFPMSEITPILSYANGPGYKPAINGSSHNFTADKIDYDYQYPGLINTIQESHGGDDVLIYARGPWSHLFEGVMEQNAIPHLMAYALCVGDKSTICKDRSSSEGSGSSMVSSSFNVIICIQMVLTFVIIKIFST